MGDEQPRSGHAKFMSEKSKFKQDLMMSNTIPYGKKKTGSQHFEELNTSPTNFKTMKEKEILSVPRSQKSKNLTGSSGQSASDDFSDDNMPGNQFDFQQIFDNQDMSKEEEELFNQLKAQEEGHEELEDQSRKQDELGNYPQSISHQSNEQTNGQSFQQRNQNDSGSNNSYDDEEGESSGSPDRDGYQQQQMQQMLNT